MIDSGLDLPVSRQCLLLGLARSTYYYRVQEHGVRHQPGVMEEIDRLYLAHPRTARG